MHFLSLDMPLHQLPARQSNSSQSVDTGGSDASELRTSQPRRPLVAPRGRQISTMQAIEDRTAHLEREDHLHDNCRLR